jgi:hypothetical protein
VFFLEWRNVFWKHVPLCLTGIRVLSKGVFKTKQNKKNSMVRVRERTIPTWRQPLVGELVTTFADRGCHVVRLPDPYGRILGSLDRSRYFFFQAAPLLYSRGWVAHVSDPLLLRKSGNPGNRTRASRSVARNSDHYDHRGGLLSSK